jgi:hypothetical protein
MCVCVYVCMCVCMCACVYGISDGEYAGVVDADHVPCVCVCVCVCVGMGWGGRNYKEIIRQYIRIYQDISTSRHHPPHMSPEVPGNASVTDSLSCAKSAWKRVRE